jgi:uncharacterized protein (TIGR03663 family)
MNRWVAIALFLVTLCALALRVPEMDRRPMHNDEAVNAIKLQGLWEKGVYEYDPNEYHGPFLYYAALPVVWLSGAKDFAGLTESTLRLTPVIFGAGLILLLWFLVDGLGRPGTVFAGVFAAISPAMVFYSRYFIHEMLLVFLTLLLLAAGWRYLRTPRVGWAVLAGAAVGLMYATKETFVLTLAAISGAVVLTALWNVCVLRQAFPAPTAGAPGLSTPIAPVDSTTCQVRALRACLAGLWNWKHALAALLTAGVVAVVFFTSFFSHLAGALDALRTYLPWLHRAGGASPHNQPWFFYLERLLWFHQGRGPVWTELVIAGLAAVGFLAFLRSRPPAFGNPCLVRFLGFYTLLLTAVYSFISYKTPWCCLSFWLGAILLAGIGAAVVVRWQTKRWLQALLSGLLVLAAAHLVWLAWEASYTQPADRRNPYAYAQTSPDILELVEKVQTLARLHPDGHQMLIKIMVPDRDYWPLPWYLRQFQRTGWWDTLPPDPLAPVMIVGAGLEGGLGDKMDESHIMVGIYSLRPRIFLNLYVAEPLWKRFMAEKDKTGHN